MATTHQALLIPGDGIGPEVSDAVVQIFKAAKAPVEFETHLAGISAMDATGKLLPDATVDAARRLKIGMKGPCTTPVGKGFRSVNVTLRRTLDLYGAARPVRSMPGVPTRYEDVDVIVMRENSEGLYSGIENVVTDGVVTSIKVTTRDASRRMAKWTFDYARKHGRKKVTVFHKANIIKQGDGLFLQSAKDVFEEGGYSSDLEFDSCIIDAACMKLVQDPNRFDMVLMQNLYGDLISDLCSGFVGGLGVVPGANIGDDCALFEAVHGSAPDIAGKGVANPLAFLMSGVMMLRYLGAERNDANANAAADRIENAYQACLAAGEKTKDLGGELNTQGFVDAVNARLA